MVGRGTIPRQVAAVRGGPKIVCLCGSTRFKEQFISTQFAETMIGNIVLTVGWFSHADGDKYTPTVKEKEKLDELHKRKIDLAEEVIFICPGGYIGDSTRGELAYAKETGKRCLFPYGNPSL